MCGRLMRTQETRYNPLTALMIRRLALCAPLVLCLSALGQDVPGWAYPVNPPEAAAKAAQPGRISVPESVVSFEAGQLSILAPSVPDWHPEEHPTMPNAVGKGRPPVVYACAYCHLPNGAGRPENTSLAGLSAAYIREQMAAFKAGKRRGSEPNRGPQNSMIALSSAATDTEVDEAALYFSSLKPACFVRVVESATVPKFRVAGWTLTTIAGGGSEPIGERIVEMPLDFSRFEHRDSRTRYIAYVPPGSIARGAELAATGAHGRSVACITCHGARLEGVADVPRLAGRSPSYLVRQLFDLRAGNRSGGVSDIMKPVVANLTNEDIVALAAFIASSEP